MLLLFRDRCWRDSFLNVPEWWFMMLLECRYNHWRELRLLNIPGRTSVMLLLFRYSHSRDISGLNVPGWTFCNELWHRSNNLSDGRLLNDLFSKV